MAQLNEAALKLLSQAEVIHKANCGEDRENFENH
jgi:hypothetical protein